MTNEGCTKRSMNKCMCIAASSWNCVQILMNYKNSTLAGRKAMKVGGWLQSLSCTKLETQAYIELDS